MAEPQSFDHFVGLTVTDQDDNKIGKVEAVLLDKNTNTPTWLAVEHRKIAKKTHLIPIATVIESDGNLLTSITQDQVVESPAVDPAALTTDQEEEIYTYFGVNHSEGGHSGQRLAEATSKSETVGVVVPTDELADESDTKSDDN